MVLSDDSGKATQDENHMEDCLTQMGKEKSLNTKMREKILNPLSTQKKSSRNRFLMCLDTLCSRRE